MRLPVKIRNFFSGLVGLPIICPNCYSEMVKSGHPKGFFQHYKCLDCGYGSLDLYEVEEDE